MSKAVIKTGGRQYIVSKNNILDVGLLDTDKKSVSFDPLLVIAKEKIQIGNPIVSGAKVVAEIIESEIKTDKVTSIRYTAKKRVHKVKGHRPKVTKLKVTSIT